MNNSTSPTPHFCTNNCKSPIRAARPQNPIHPYLHEVNVRHIDFNSCVGAVEFDKFNLRNTAGSETCTPSPSAAVAENSQITSESDTPPAPVRAAARKCQYCNGDGYYFYYDTPTPCDDCNGTGKAAAREDGVR